MSGTISIPSRRPPLRRLLAAACSLVVLLAAAASAQTAVTVSVDTNALMSTFSPMGLGMHTSPYYNYFGDGRIDDIAEEAGVTTLRFGGGGYADVYHWSVARPQWESGITGGGLSPWWGESGNFGYVGPNNDFGVFINKVDDIENGRGVVTVNYGSALKLVGGQSQVPDFGGQPKEAAAQVAYANADPAIYGTAADVPLGVDQQGNDWKTAGYWARLRASTPGEYQSWANADGVYEPLNRHLAINRDDGAGIEYWEIGNETFGTGYYGGGRGYSVDYDLAYGVNRTGAAELSPAQYGQEIVEYAQLMRSVDPTIKIGAVLATPPDDTWSIRNGQSWNDQVLEQAADETDFVMVHWYPTTNASGSSILEEVGEKIPLMIDGGPAGGLPSVRESLTTHGIPDAEIMVTEFNYFGDITSEPADPAEANFVADAYASWLELGVTSVQFLELMGKDFIGDAAFNQTNEFTLGSAFYGVSAVDKLGRPGDQFVETESSEDELRTHAVVQADSSLAVMLLNHDRFSDAEVTVDVTGMRLASDGVQYSVLDGLSLSESPLGGLSDLFTVTIPTRSLAVIVIPASLAGDFNNDGTVDAADFTVWRDGLDTGDYTQADYDLWVEHFGETQAPPAASFTPGESVPEPSALWLALLAIAARRTQFGRCG
ncbi:hypothetical protein Mal64_01640 [Pseudobythopirellula maris]|uniref:Alpha-L-arabinofuranosidase n=1 Tax=Pseudobythopirellula maris TaxID=2527991 RepID=A0A5C5ZRS1_9BACT|nr:hypothetical protein [Pseudobythopirellula maris]TWT89785.1 hypothetical protein Mal64_01640 [Pseudobythopirellula maris]